MSSPSLIESVSALVSAKLSGINTAIPGRVIQYTPSTRKAQVKPLVKRRYRDQTVLDNPIIDDVPVVFPSSGASGLTFPIVVGDTVLLVFSQRSMDKWLLSGDEVDPEDRRTFALSDAIAIPGLFSFNKAPAAGSQDTVRLRSSAKVAIGNDSLELLQVISDFIDLVATGVATAGSPLSTAPQMTALKAQLDSLLKGTL